MAELLPETESAAPAADVVAALTLQRSVSPGSKLYAQRWLPTTALPELLELRPERFNNTRIHRVLDDLFAATPDTQEHLDDLERFVKELNTALSCARQHRKEESTRRKIMQRIGRHNYMDVLGPVKIPGFCFTIPCLGRGVPEAAEDMYIRSMFRRPGGDSPPETVNPNDRSRQ